MDDAVIRPLSNPRAATAGITARPAPGNPLAAAVMWHFKEIAGAICQEPAPVDLVLLRVVLRGMAEVCGLLVERGGEAPVRPPSLFSDDRVVSEALGDVLAFPQAHAPEVPANRIDSGGRSRQDLWHCSGGTGACIR